MAKGKTYEEFVEKFEPKKTTDDCYTPPLVYEAVADWVATRYGLNSDDFVRPFYPEGDYEHFDYGNKIVVDNPPFSILTQIIKFYVDKNIKFFLFAPTLTGLVRYSDYCTAIPIGISVTYENKARVNTSFVTNLEPHEIRMMSAPSLYKAVKKADEQFFKTLTKKVPKYEYPLDVITSAQMYQYSRLGVDFAIKRDESERISTLDSQRASKKSIFGCGLLISDKKKAEREKAEREKAEREKAEREKAEREKAEREKVEVWTLSERELKLIANLNTN
jgi:hypothetical protein